MRWLFYLIIAFPIQATASDADRKAAIEIFADASALAVLCKDPIYSIDRDTWIGVFSSVNFVDSEVDRINERLDDRIKELNGEEQDILCRDAYEKYGPNGIILKNLLKN